MAKSTNEALRKRMDQMVLGALCGTQNVTQQQPETEPFTLGRLQAMIDRMPPKDTWLSSKLFPRDTAQQLKTSKENWLVAHPDFWVQLFAHAVKLSEDQRKSLISPFAPTVINIDHSESDDDRTKARKDRERKRWCDALEWSVRAKDLMSKVALRPSFNFPTRD